MQIAEKFSKSLPITTLFALLFVIGVQHAVAERDDIASFNVVSDTPKELVLDVQYYYSGRYGDVAYLGSAMANSGQVSPYYAHNPGRITPGYGSTRLRLGVNEQTAPQQFTTNQIYLHMYGGSDRGTFYGEFFPYVKTWGVGHSGGSRTPKPPSHVSDISSVEGHVLDYWIIKDEPNKLVLGVQYYYSGRYDKGRARRAVLGAEPAGPGALGSGIGFKPVILRSGNNTVTIDMTKVTPGSASSNGFRLYMYTCESVHACKNPRTFFSRNYSYKKEWYAR